MREKLLFYKRGVASIEAFQFGIRFRQFFLWIFIVLWFLSPLHDICPKWIAVIAVLYVLVLQLYLDIVKFRLPRMIRDFIYDVERHLEMQTKVMEGYCNLKESIMNDAALSCKQALLLYLSFLTHQGDGNDFSEENIMKQLDKSYKESEELIKEYEDITADASRLLDTLLIKLKKL